MSISSYRILYGTTTTPRLQLDLKKVQLFQKLPSFPGRISGPTIKAKEEFLFKP